MACVDSVTVSPIINEVTVSPVIQSVTVSLVGIQGIQGEKGDSGAAINTFESVSKNLLAWDYTLNYTGTDLTSIVYTNGIETITKTLTYSGGLLTIITLSGDTPSGIDLIKTLTYTAGTLTGVVYS